MITWLWPAFVAVAFSLAPESTPRLTRGFVRVIKCPKLERAGIVLQSGTSGQIVEVRCPYKNCTDSDHKQLLQGKRVYANGRRFLRDWSNPSAPK